MSRDPNAPRWTGQPGFYEVWYLTLTDPATGIGLWIRYTLLASASKAPTASLWFLAMEPGTEPIARKETVPASELQLAGEKLRFEVPHGRLDGRGMSGAFEDVSWELEWGGKGGAFGHVHPVLERLGIAKTVLTLPHGDLRVHGTVRLPGGRELSLDGVPGGQAHLWGTKHAARWAWAHCNDFAGTPGDLLDGVTVWVPRFGRPEVGPSTPVVARFGGEDYSSTSPGRVATNASRAGLTSWTFEARGPRGRRLEVDVDAPRESLAGVTYEDPDGEAAYCYNTEIASMRVRVFHRGALVRTAVADGRAHFEYGQRDPVAGVPLRL